MPCYIISYDLIEGGDYEGIFKAIKDYGTWAHITESTWAIVTEDDHVKIRDNLGKYVPDKGRIFVVKSASVGAWRNVICKNEWLKKNL